MLYNSLSVLALLYGAGYLRGKLYYAVKAVHILCPDHINKVIGAAEICRLLTYRKVLVLVCSRLAKNLIEELTVGYISNSG